MKVDHIGIVVRDIQAALQVYQKALGLPLKDTVQMPEQEVDVAFLSLGETDVELVQPTTTGSGVAKYLRERGEGIHHICIQVGDIDATLAQLRAHDVQLIDQEPRRGAHGRVAFIHPRGAHGVLVELIEYDR